MKKLKMIPLGGLGEIGKNSIIWEYDNQIVVVDAGLKFPGEEEWGIDYLIPDFSYLKGKRVLGVILTHGHEDHVGALSYLMNIVKAPVLGTPMTLGLAEHRLRENNIDAEFKILNPDDEYSFGPFTFEFARVNHSVPGGVGFALKTPVGTIVHSGDFKIDNSPVDGQYTDLPKFTEWGKRGVLLFTSDSTNADEPGYVKSERTVRETLDAVFTGFKGLIVVTTFASNVQRIGQVLEVAEKHGRKVVVDGKSMVITVETARRLGYLSTQKDIFINMDEASKYSRNKLVVLTTGSQGEPMSVLSRLANGEYKKIQVEKGDMVVISAEPIPGNERTVNRIINTLMWKGVEVVHSDTHGVHTSGHAKQEELKLLLSLVKPKYFIPIHGEERHLVSHAKLASDYFVPSKKVLLLKCGDVVELFEDKVKVINSLNMDTIYVDGLGVGDLKEVVLRERSVLAREGIVIVGLHLTGDEKYFIKPPEIKAIGLLYEKGSEEIIKELREYIKDYVSLEGLDKKKLEKSIEKFFSRKLKRRPYVVVLSFS